MSFRWIISAVCFGLALALSHAGEPLKSGPQPGTLIPGSFDPFNVNGKHAGRHHCLVCKYGLTPTIMVFAREPAEGKDGPLTDLLKKMDDLLDQRQETDFLAGFVVFLSPFARSSVTEPKLEDAGELEKAGKLVEEAIARDGLTKRLEARAEKLKNVVVAHYPAAGPKGYGIHDKAEVTVVFYDRYKVLANHAFAAGKMTDEDAGTIVASIEKILVDSKKKPAPVKKK
jgi:hypothetical protein